VTSCSGASIVMWREYRAAGRPEDSALEALRIISEAVAAHGQLEGLNLSDNALGEKGVRAFAAGLSGQVQTCMGLDDVDGCISMGRAHDSRLAQSRSCVS
jgi:phage tail tube protein FII